MVTGFQWPEIEEKLDVAEIIEMNTSVRATAPCFERERAYCSDHPLR